MNLERLAPLSGVVSVALLIVATLLVNNYSFLPPADELRAFYTDNSLRLQIAGYLGALGAVILIWFAGSVRHSLRPAEGGTGRLLAVSFGAGAVAGGLLAVALAFLAAAAARAGADDGISADTAVTIYDLYGSIAGIAVPMALGVFIGAAAVVALRTKVWPAWLAWVSVVLAIGSLSPISYIFVGIDLVWILVVAIWLFMREPAEARAAG